MFKKCLFPLLNFLFLLLFTHTKKSRSNNFTHKTKIVAKLASQYSGAKVLQSPGAVLLYPNTTIATLYDRSAENRSEEQRSTSGWPPRPPTMPAPLRHHAVTIGAFCSKVKLILSFFLWCKLFFYD